MSCKNLGLYAVTAVTAAALGLVVLDSRSGAQPSGQPGGPPGDPNLIVQGFPTAGPAQTTWKVRWALVNPGNGLVITGAWFKKSPTARWLQVLHDLRLSEIFVPYNNSTRIYDIGSRGFPMAEVSQKDAGPKGKLLMALDAQKKVARPYVVQELRDTGVLYKYYKNTRRGEALVLWATIGAANYNYIVEYSFRDDGTINARLGASGQNFGNHYTMGHMHNGCWRIDVDLMEEGGDNRNTVKVVKHIEPSYHPSDARETAREVEVDFNGGFEGGLPWKESEFTTLRVLANGLKNGHDHPVSYDLLPYLRPGTPRHFGKNEEFTRHDFWVTPFDAKEQYFIRLPEYTTKSWPRRNVKNTDVVLWYQSPMHHVPRDEDGIFPMAKGRPVRQGVTLCMWGGFDLRPRNVFDATPLYP